MVHIQAGNITLGFEGLRINFLAAEKEIGIGGSSLACSVG
jgi:hypothetical protein